MKLPQPKGHSTTWGQKISYWSYAIGMIFYYTIVGSYFNTYLLSKGVPMMVISTVFLFTKIWDAINDPLFSYLFDKLKFKGKRKEKCLPWMRIAAVIMPLASIACFNMVDGMSMAGMVAWMAVTYVLWDMSYTVCDVPFFAMSTTMTTNMDERNFLFSWARVFHGAGTLLTTTMMTTMVGEVGNMPFGTAAIITCAVGFLFTLPICFFGKEKYAVTEEDPNAPEKEPFNFKQMWTCLKANKFLLLMYACQIVDSMTSIGDATGMMSTYYIYGSVQWTVVQTWISMISGPVLGLVLPLLLKKWDRFNMYISCMIFGLVVTVFNFSAYYLGWLSIPFALIITCIRAIPGTLQGLLAYTFTLDCLEYGRYKTGVDATGINFAVQTFSAKIPGAANTFISGVLTSMTSFIIYEFDQLTELDHLPQPEGALDQIWSIGLVNIIFDVVVVFLLLKFYKLKSKDAAIMAKYNVGEISREECDAQLSRKY